MITIKEINYFKFRENSKSKEYWLNRPYISEDLRNKLLNADILILPQEGYEKYDQPLFPNGTEDLLLYLKENAQGKFIVDICIESKDYEELHLYEDLIIIGSFFVSAIFLPIITSLVASYIKDRLGKRMEKVDIKCDFTIDNQKKFVKLSYQGPAPYFVQSIDRILDSFDNLDRNDLDIQESHNEIRKDHENKKEE